MGASTESTSDGPTHSLRSLFRCLNALPLLLLLASVQVTGIVGRADVLACIFFLISLLAYHG